MRITLRRRATIELSLAGYMWNVVPKIPSYEVGILTGSDDRCICYSTRGCHSLGEIC
ncbi:delta-12 fatty acid desaturase [Moniliophthora roreri]|nr:delta-12 fatty acid desaturase [Moniliophthora roreri]